jgi:hypothetical protein
MIGAEQTKILSTPMRNVDDDKQSASSPLSVFMKKLLWANQDGACTTILVLEDNPPCVCGRTCSSLSKKDSPRAYRWKNGALKDSIRPKRRLPSLDDAILSIAAAEIIGAAAEIVGHGSFTVLDSVQGHTRRAFENAFADSLASPKSTEINNRLPICTPQA